MDANELRRTFTGFFTERTHTLVPSAGLIPHHPRAPLFTNAGMNQFLPYILAEESPPHPRATSVQKCVRVKGKHDDIEEVGRSPYHLSFFEMLGNFSFGDYFKEGAIPFAWELVTEVLGLDGDRVWVTVHESDDEAEQIWRDSVGVPAGRIQRMGADNFWEMGETGPCGPSSEMYYDKGESLGEGGGPAAGSARRYLEFWNLVFMQYDRRADGSLDELQRKVIDTGAGLERNLCILQGTESVFDTDELLRLVDAAARVTGRRRGDDPRIDVALRILADHARTMTFLVSDGVVPSNEDRGYVLRRVIRRAVRHAHQLDMQTLVTPALVDDTGEVMGADYPDLARNRDFVIGVVTREEERFRQTLKSGSNILDAELDKVASVISGDVAFRLHDTFGFPIDLTREIAAERGVDVDLDGFESAMGEQRRRGKEARKGAEGDGEPVEEYREVVEQFGPTEFTGYQETESKARVLAVVGDRLFLDRTPFYAESGGQVGDTGWITTETGEARVLDTTYALPGLHGHRVELVQGEIVPEQEAVARGEVAR